MTENEARRMPALVLAYEGDAVYELKVRTYLLTATDGTVNALHRKARDFVSAAAQSSFMEFLEPILTEQEREIYHRGRNAKSHSRPKNAEMICYRRATGFECLFGYLYLSEQYQRIDTLFDYILEQSAN